MINMDSRGHSYFIVKERKLGAQRRSDTVPVSTINDADQESADVANRTPLAPYEKSKFLGSGRSMVERIENKAKWYEVQYQVRGPHYSSDCQTRNPLVYEPNRCNNYDLPHFDQPPQYPIVHPPLHEMSLHELIIMMNLGTPTPEPLVNSFVYEESNDDIEVPPAYTPSLPFLTTMEPLDTLLMGDEDSSTNSARETNKFINSHVDDLVPILRESEVTLVSTDLDCDMLVNTPLPTTNVREENFDINSPLGEHVVYFLIKNEDIVDLPRHLVKRLLCYLVKNPSSTKRMFDEPLGDDSQPRSYDVTFSNSLLDFNDDSTLCYDNPLFDDEFEDISSLEPPESTLVINESTLLVTPLPDSKSGGKMRVMETPSFGFHHMSSPCPAAYSLKEVMYRYYHPHLTSGDGFDPEIKRFPMIERNPTAMSVTMWKPRGADVDNTTKRALSKNRTLVLPTRALGRPRRAFWSLNDEIKKDTVLTLYTPYPSRRYRVSTPALHKKPRRYQDLYAVSRMLIRRIEDKDKENYGLFYSWHPLQGLSNTPYPLTLYGVSD
ncbi:hypothetical protein Tco_0691058 [Tanacetum coccineum]